SSPNVCSSSFNTLSEYSPSFVASAAGLPADPSTASPAAGDGEGILCSPRLPSLSLTSEPPPPTAASPDLRRASGKGVTVAFPPPWTTITPRDTERPPESPAPFRV
ncbi:unnamed protein product, partial [Ectocarpus sp. 12 AP-2014]